MNRLGLSERSALVNLFEFDFHSDCFGSGFHIIFTFITQIAIFPFVIFILPLGSPYSWILARNWEPAQDPLAQY